MALNYELEQANDNYKFTIASKFWSVVGVMSNEMPIAGGNQFDTTADVLSNIPIIGKGLAIKSKFSDVFKLSGQSSITDFETRLVWTGSDKPQFTIDYKFYNSSTLVSESVRGAMVQAKQLQATVLPSKGTPAIGRKGTFFRAPLNYKFHSSGDLNGTLSLEIGNWFRASKLLARSTNFTPSIQVMGNGEPLFVLGSITLEPYQAITYEEFVGFFRKSSNKVVVGSGNAGFAQG
jgi:hypothetical protein